MIIFTSCYLTGMAIMAIVLISMMIEDPEDFEMGESIDYRDVLFSVLIVLFWPFLLAMIVTDAVSARRAHLRDYDPDRY